MKRLTLCALMLAAALLAACGGNDTREGLPEGFPADFPVYSHAHLINSFSKEVANGKMGFYASWETGDDVDSVKEFYRKSLGDRYRVQATSTILSTNRITFEDAKGELGTGVLTLQGIRGSNPRTSIAATLGLPRASSVQAQPTAGVSPEPAQQLPAAVPLPADYPSSVVPVPAGAVIVAAQSAEVEAGKAFGVTALTRETPAAIKDGYLQTFSSAVPPASATEEGAAWVVAFEVSGLQGAVAAAPSSEYAGFTRVDILVEQR